VQVYNFPPVGRTGFLWEKMGVDWKFRIKYRSPDGWVVASPEFQIEPKIDQAVNWEKN
jgi:hypothetical protein